MATFKGLLYVKHGRLGLRGEGPDYYLQTSCGEYLLHAADRDLWKRDYLLEFYCRHMVEVQGDVADGVQIQVQEIQDICETVIPESHDDYQIRIANTGTVEISGIQLGMIGSHDASLLAGLAPGVTSEYYPFRLRTPGRERTAVCYGDYVGTYVQAATEKSLHVARPGKVITVRIDDTGYAVNKDATQHLSDIP